MKKIFFIIACLLTQLTNTIHHVGLPQYRKQPQQTFTDFCKQEVFITPQRMVGAGACGLCAGITIGLAKGVEVPSQMSTYLLKFPLYGACLGTACGMLITITAIALKISDNLCLGVFELLKNYAFTPLKVIKQRTQKTNIV